MYDGRLFQDLIRLLVLLAAMMVFPKVVGAVKKEESAEKRNDPPERDMTHPGERKTADKDALRQK